LQIHDIECHHTTEGIDVRVVFVAMNSDFCDRGLGAEQVHAYFQTMTYRRTGTLLTVDGGLLACPPLQAN